MWRKGGLSIPARDLYMGLWLLIGTVAGGHLALICHIPGSETIGQLLAFVMLLRWQFSRAGNLIVAYALAAAALVLTQQPLGLPAFWFVVAHLAGLGVAAATWRPVRPLQDEQIDQLMTLKLLACFVLLALPTTLAIEALVRLAHPSPLAQPSAMMPLEALFLRWLERSFTALCLLIPLLKTNRRRLLRLCHWPAARHYIAAWLLALLIALPILLLNSHPFIYLTFGLAFIVFRHGAFFASCTTMLTFFCLVFLVRTGLMPKPLAISQMGSIPFWIATSLTLFSLQLIGLMSELMSRSAHRGHESEARMRGALEFAATGFALTTLDGVIIEANACLCQLLGYQREELLGKMAPELSHPEDLEQAQTSLRQLQNGEIDHYTFEKRYLRKGGLAVWVNVRVSVLRYANGHPYELIIQVDDISERKAADEALRDQANRLRLALSIAHAGAWEWHLDGTEHWWTEEVYHIIGCQRSETIPSQAVWMQAVHPEDRPRLEAVIAAAIAERHGYCEMYRLIRRDGAVIWIEDHAELEYNEQGEVTRIYGVSQDVTERALIEQAIQHSENRLRAILDCAVDAIVTMDSHSRIHSFNAAAEQMFGYRESEVIGEDIALLMPSPHKERHASYVRRYQETGNTTLMGTRRELMACHRSGRLFPIELSVAEISSNGERFYTGMMRDISAHKAAEQALLSARAELQGVINAASEIAIIVTNAEGMITLFNSGAERMLGYEASEVVGLRTPLFLHDLQEVVSRGLALTEEAGHPVSGFAVFVSQAIRHGHEVREWSFIRKDRSRLTVLMTVTPIRDTDGLISGFLSIAKDISPLKQTQSELLLAKEQAEAASRAKSAFLANMSHEIRTPLNAVLGMAYLLDGTPLEGQQRQYVHMISSAGRSLLQILNDILDFSKIEAGRMELSPAEFNLDEMIEGLAGIMAVSAGNKELALYIAVDPALPRVWIADGLRLQQILLNLLGNAIKFTQHGHVMLTIQPAPAALDAAHQCTVRFEVSDTGIGMTAQQTSRLFVPFTQADTSTTRQFGGTGLGLAISRRLAEMMGGQIDVHSQAGAGSCFTVIVPMMPGRPSATPLPLARTTAWLLCLSDTAYRCHQQTLQTLGADCQRVTQIDELANLPAQAQPSLLLIDIPLADTRAWLQLARVLPTLTLPTIILYHLAEKTRLPEFVDDRRYRILTQPLTCRSLLAVTEEVQLSVATSATPPSPPLPTIVTTDSVAPRLQGRHLLLVEDNEVNQLIACRILTSHGAEVDVAGNGIEALNLLRAHPTRYALVLMDVQMPLMDGYMATQAIRQELGLTIPILAMTAGVMSSEQQACRQVGMNDIIAKPIDVDAMLATLQRYLAPDSAAAPGAATTPPTACYETDVGASAPLDERSCDLQGLHTLLGDDEALVSRLLTQFQHESQQLHAQLLAVLEQQDKETAARIVHTLKGHAGTLGAQRLARLARQIEQSIRGHTALDHSNLLPELFAALDELRGDIDHWLTEHADLAALPAAINDDMATDRLLQRFVQQLAEQNLAALDQFDALRGYLLPRLGEELFSTFTHAVETLAFADALALLRQSPLAPLIPAD